MADMVIESDSDDEILRDLFLRTRKMQTVRPRPDLFEKFDDDEFFVRFRLTKETVLRLLDMINDRLEHMTDRNHSISPMNQLLLTLRYFACGDFVICVADFCSIDKGTASRIIHKVVESIARLAPRFIKFPETQIEIARVQQEFFKIAAFPRVTGAIDCTHIKIRSPGGRNAEEYRGRKGFFSYNVQTVSSADLRIIDIVVRWPGAAHDQTIFNNSALKARFERGLMGNRILLGDSGYAATPYLLTPITYPRTPAENLYNESQIRTRNVVERTYGVWKRRFPVLVNEIRLKTERIEAVIVACAVLHNLAVEMNEDLPEIDPQLQEAINAAIDDERGAVVNEDVGHVAVRDNFVDYFGSRL